MKPTLLLPRSLLMWLLCLGAATFWIAATGHDALAGRYTFPTDLGAVLAFGLGLPLLLAGSIWLGRRAFIVRLRLGF